jgi:LDH2 family malate/lactate/ureidoglycolate dehydrogenase
MAAMKSVARAKDLREARVPFEALERFGRALAMAAGVPQKEAEALAETLAWCDLRGHQTQGLYLLPILLKRMRLGLVSSPADMRWRKTAPSTGTLDARHGFGQIAGRLAVGHAIRLAKETGVGLVAVKNSNHFGAAGYYAGRAAEQGFIGLAYANSMPKVAPHGGRHRLLGTNPFAFSCPRRNAPPLIIDLATGASAGSLVSHARRTGQRLPEGIALDSAGNPTTDPNEVDGGGCLLPMGGAKGYCLGLLVEILSGVLTGAAVAPSVGSVFRDLDRQTRSGHLFVVIDIARFLSPESFFERLEGLLTALTAVAPRDGFESVSLPGDARQRCASEQASAGIAMPDYLITALTEIASELKVRTPWTVGRPATGDDA